MKYLLDTNICVYWLKGNKHIEQKVLSGGIDNIFVSFITASELYADARPSAFSLRTVPFVPAEGPSICGTSANLYGGYGGCL